MNPKRRKTLHSGNTPSLRPRTERTPENAAIRVIGGTLRGRIIKIGVDPRTRPMKDRTRQAMFNLLGNHLDGCIAFDLFAGTGVIAIESISRGADRAFAIELLPHLAKNIQSYSELFRIQEQLVVHRGNAFDFLLDQQDMSEEVKDRPWHIFICPPFPLWETGKSELSGLVASWLQASPVGSHCICELDFASNPDVLPETYSWDIREYRPAKLAITKKT